MEKPTMSEDASPIENGDFLAMLVFGGGTPRCGIHFSADSAGCCGCPASGAKNGQHMVKYIKLSMNLLWKFSEKHYMYMCNDYGIIFKK